MSDGGRIKTEAMAAISDYEKRYRLEEPTRDRPAPMRVEDNFDEFVANFGGCKISDLIPEKNNMPLNADYLFREQDVIAELKTLEGIYSGREGLKSLEQMFIDAGLDGDAFMSVLLGEQDLPDAIQARILKRVRRAIEQRVIKARKQLRYSKKAFGNPETKSLMIIAMDQPPLIGQKNMLLVLAQLMGDNYRDEHIDGVIYINPNVPVRIQDDGMEFGGWFPFYRDDETNDGLSEFVNLLGDRWLKFHAEKTGNPNPILKFDDPISAFAALDGASVTTAEILEKRG